MLPSRVDHVQLRGREVFIKRDDLIDTCLSGNKYRKFYTLVNTPSSHYTKIISYGGTQSNAMYAISCLCKEKGWEFEYYCKPLSSHLKEELCGNLQKSIANGMDLHEVAYEDFQDKIEALQGYKEDKTLVISQGGADTIASEGVKALAQEINTWKNESNIKKLSVVLPSGTGTTALYLKNWLDTDIDIYTSVLIGDRNYQMQQWKRLSDGPYPKILPTSGKFRFAKPYDEFLQMYKELGSSTEIIFDLIYAPKTWIELMNFFNDSDTKILYIHTGGVSGNETMLERYAHKKSRK